MRTDGRRDPLMAACIGSALLFAAVFLVYSPRYATNDDPLIAMLASGTGFAPAPDEHLVFTNVLIGCGLRRLYRWAPELPWYALYLLATHVLAQTALLYAGLRAEPRWPTAAIYLAWFAVAAVPFANDLHFTVTAFVAAQAGLLLALTLLQAGPRPPHRALHVVAAVALAVFGSLIRFEAFALALVLTLPAAAVAAWGRQRRDVRAAAVALGASLALAVAARAFDVAYYARDPAWSEYREFNGLLRQFVDFEHATEYTPDSAAAFRGVGWSRNDHRLLLNWFHPDDDVFSAANLQAVLAQVARSSPSRAARLQPALGRIWRNRVAISILLALPLAVVACATTRSSRRAMFAALLAIAGVLVWLAVWRKAPPHVYLPVLAWPLALAVVLPRALPQGRAARVAAGIAAALAAAGATRALVFQRAETVEAAAREESYARGLGALRAGSDALPVLWSTFPYHVAAPLRGAGPLPGARFVALGWPQRTPPAADTLRRLGHRDLVQALRDPRVRLVAPAEAAAWIEQYARRHHALPLVLVPDGQVPGFPVFRGTVADRAISREFDGR